MKVLVFIAGVALALATAASAEDRTCIAMCSRTDASSTWSSMAQTPELWLQAGSPTPAERITVMVGLRAPDGGRALRAKFFAVSDPASPDYRNFWSRKELIAAVAADKLDVQAVAAWMAEAGAEPRLTATGDWLETTMTVAQAETLFGAKIEAFTWATDDSDARILRTLEAVTVPTTVAPLVTAVVGLTSFPVTLGARRSRRESGVSLGTPKVTPQLLYKHYNVTEPAPKVANLTMACAEFEHQSFSPRDLTRFQRDFKLAEQKVSKVVGPNDGLGHTEANLDIQYIMALAQGVEAEMWLQSGLSFNLVKWAQDVLASSDIPLVWSMSYGEAIETISVSEAQQYNAELQKFGSLGVTQIAAAGDTGVYSRGHPTGGIFYPTYPASLPAVTAVGATQMTDSGDENSCTDWSGGGFAPSKYFASATEAPWQVDAIHAYFASGVDLPPVAYYDSHGTGFPDVSALGVDFEVVMGLIREPVSGTSAASPTFAGIIANVNAHLINAGSRPLGFLNPFLYAHPEAFNDITQGKNDDGTKYGFEATKGWDPASGLGTPNFAAILTAAMAA
ncbi:tripeptidyl-peptidase 1 [Thecamonas trahens ATCC 50062]|uniref:Tripeptidyl-peptidase 1 n=1 Tax=Thecamonas trahens ATCC 50062 TaxID=461836 RepID=A0A0L0DGL2_THETB|nr:tripeptidyl-peptidase 1 [Thecamonas trahens ATCC 50062]KNC50473.1 tripeptidyl-peptidase 1 [Thecamonas trahens ATCC 50062]|eukprot:XP_013762369.1 tripeptidyl-peptidase 1 [Thecamonas trahens ATCC 50062]